MPKVSVPDVDPVGTTRALLAELPADPAQITRAQLTALEEASGRLADWGAVLRRRSDELTRRMRRGEGAALPARRAIAALAGHRERCQLVADCVDRRLADVYPDSQRHAS